jgi:transposase, IS5 family
MMETQDFFRARLDAMIDLKHPLAVLATKLPWGQLEAELAPIWQRRARDGVIDDGGDLLAESGGKLQAAGVSYAGRPRLSIRLLCSLVYLKHAFNLSDEALVERWSENVVWQHFSGLEYYEPRLPCDATQIGRFRCAIGEAGMEAILKATVDAALEIKAIKPAEFERIIVDTTVQEKAVSYPVDARLLEIARHKLVTHAKRCGMVLRQTFAKEGKTLRRKAGGYAHAKQFKRLARTVKRQRTIVGRLIREVRGKLDSGAFDVSSSPLTLASFNALLARADRIRTQRRKDKNKLYALHAPEVECISKGKARNRYEFGVKVSLAITHKQGLIVGAKRFTGNPFDGHTLAAQIVQCNGVIEGSGKAVKQAFVDLGYRGVDADNPGVTVTHRGRIKSMSKNERKQLKRRQAIEPTIGHVKHDHRMIRCHLQGSTGDALHAIACAAGYNIRWLMRAMLRLGLKGLFALFSLITLWRSGQPSRSSPTAVLKPMSDHVPLLSREILV